MGLQLLNIDTTEKKVLDVFRQLPSTSKKIIQKQLEEMLEKLEDEEDLRDARLAMKEKSISAQELYKKLGL